MTKFTDILTIGTVVVNKVEAEILDTPPKFMLDCTQCGWGTSPISSQIVAEREAANHRDEGCTNDAD